MTAEKPPGTASDPRIEIHQGDIARLEVEAIINAANDQLLPGAGVCGAIHRAAGPALAVACARVAPCPTGEARITPGFALPASYVIHAVGPVWQGGEQGEPELLAACYRSALALAADKGLRSIAFPAISTGIYGFPLERATAIAVAETGAGLARYPGLERLVFCVFGAEAEAAYRQALRAS